MSFDVDRYPATWAHIALCADITWTAEPPDEFIIANQRLWARHCRISQFLQETATDSQSSVHTNNQLETTEKRGTSSQNSDNGSCSSRRSVIDVIPESRLAQFYGNFYYDEIRENCYTNTNEKTNGHWYHGKGCENSDLTECWMLPEVEYWFRKLVEETSERSAFPRRRRQHKMLCDDDFKQPVHSGYLDCVVSQMIQMADASPPPSVASAPAARRAPAYRRMPKYPEASSRLPMQQPQAYRSASEPWGPIVTQAAGEEAALAARVHSVRALWGSPPVTRDPIIPPRAPSPPPASRKIRARRKQPKRLAALAPPPPAYCLEVPTQLLCNTTCMVQFDPPRPPQLNVIEYQRAMGRLSNSVQTVMQASAARCPPYRGTNVSRYAPTPQRPARGPDKRYGTWWPRDHPSPKLDHKFQLSHLTNCNKNNQELGVKKPKETKQEDSIDDNSADKINTASDSQTEHTEKAESEKSPEKISSDDQTPSTSAAAIETDIRKKRLYSTVLSMSAPSPINLTPLGCVRISQKLVQPGLLKLNPKILLPTARIRPPNVDNKFEELEKEALEQYKASDESIDTKLSELEKQAVDQYSTSNSNTSCSSGNSAEKRTASSPSMPDDSKNKKQSPKFHKEKVDSVVIYSQNFSDLDTSTQNSVMNLKNFHTPPRGEKKEQTHRQKRNLKSEQRAASDTDYEAREVTKHHKGPMRWNLHGAPPKKRHLTLCVSDCSSDEDLVDGSGSIKDAGPCIRRHVAGKVKMSAHGGGDLIMRKT